MRGAVVVVVRLGTSTEALTARWRQVRCPVSVNRHQREYPNPICYHIQRRPTCLLTSTSPTVATAIAATTTIIAGTIQGTHRSRPVSSPISCFQPPPTAIFDVLWWCSIHGQRLQFGQSTHSIYAHGHLNPYPVQVKAAHVKSITFLALVSVEYLSSTETRSGHTASRRWARRGVAQLYRA